MTDAARRARARQFAQEIYLTYWKMAEVRGQFSNDDLVNCITEGLVAFAAEETAHLEADHRLAVAIAKVEHERADVAEQQLAEARAEIDEQREYADTWRRKFAERDVKADQQLAAATQRIAALREALASIALLFYLKDDEPYDKHIDIAHEALLRNAP